MLREAVKSKTVVFLISAMRSGSTLLKSLLANAPDTSHLPETDFQQYNRQNAWRINALSPARILILKKPATYDDFTYPLFPPIKNHKKIVLVRDAYETILSLQQMNQQPHLTDYKDWSFEKLLHEYWCMIYGNILQTVDLAAPNVQFIRYEDLVADPVQHTQSLFQFMGSAQQSGVSNYLPPDSYEWGWGKDDGGSVIKTLKVQHHPKPRTNQALLNLIAQSETAQQLRMQLGYIESGNV